MLLCIIIILMDRIAGYIQSDIIVLELSFFTHLIDYNRVVLIIVYTYMYV